MEDVKKKQEYLSRIGNSIYNFAENEDLILKLEKYFPDFESYAGTKIWINDEKFKILLQLFRAEQFIDDDDANKIISFMKQSKYGWYQDKYYLNNSCISNWQNHCKLKEILNTDELAQEAFEIITDLF